MKICQVHPACGISVPPKGWGAIEQIVWEFHQNFLALGMESEIKYVNQIERKRPPNSEVKRLYSNSTLISKITGFKQSYDLKSGLQKTIDWFTRDENLKNYKPNIYNV